VAKPGKLTTIFMIFEKYFFPSGRTAGNRGQENFCKKGHLT